MGLFLANCQKAGEQTAGPTQTALSGTSGFTPNIQTDISDTSEAQVVQAWIDETQTVLQSSQFETNMMKLSNRYPSVWISRAHDTLPTKRLMSVLKTDYSTLPGLRWAKSSVTLEGETPIRDADNSAHGFSGSRHASTGAGPDQVTGHIRLGRVHLARYKSDNLVERSCAINTMAHEISHTLSERKTEFRMHILDSGPENRPPDGIIEASYLIGSAAQCSYLEIHGRIGSDALLSCFQTFSDPTKASRFRSLACDDFSNQDLIRP